MAEALKPEKEDPNAELSVERVLLACASCPCMLRAIPKDVPSKIDSLESAMKEQNIPMEWLDQASGAVRRHAVAILWQLNRQRAGLKEKDSALDGATAQHASVAIQIATKLLMQAQMLFPHQRWVPATLAVARASALVANQLWSHTDLEAQVLMAKILKAEGLRRPKLRLEAVCEPKECLPNAKVAVKVMLLRHHRGYDGEEPPTPVSPEGFYEAYWLYVAGIKDDPTVPNSLLAAQPMVVKDLNDSSIEASCGFTAPAETGKYKLRVHVLSTSVTGVDLTVDAEFEVSDDDVPALQ
uniref:Uncharacterized protein n=1 Tax=Strombidinopsis acuminata TaxID=141414 RepID=A0A7S3XB41_9SPIT